MEAMHNSDNTELPNGAASEATDIAWGQMQFLLEKELPVEKKRRLIGLFGWAAAACVILSMSIFVTNSNTKNTSKNSANMVAKSNTKVDFFTKKAEQSIGQQTDNSTEPNIKTQRTSKAVAAIKNKITTQKTAAPVATSLPATTASEASFQHLEQQEMGKATLAPQPFIADMKTTLAKAIANKTTDEMPLLVTNVKEILTIDKIQNIDYQYNSKNSPFALSLSGNYIGSRNCLGTTVGVEMAALLTPKMHLTFGLNYGFFTNQRPSFVDASAEIFSVMPTTILNHQAINGSDNTVSTAINVFHQVAVPFAVQYAFLPRWKVRAGLVPTIFRVSQNSLNKNYPELLVDGKNNYDPSVAYPKMWAYQTNILTEISYSPTRHWAIFADYKRSFSPQSSPLFYFKHNIGLGLKYSWQ